jgi:hypothetical protein
MNDPVNNPSHYTSSAAKCKLCSEPIECIDITEHMNFCLGNAVKYIWRAGLKNEDRTIQDLEKAIWYIKRHIGKLEEQHEIGQV